MSLCISSSHDAQAGSTIRERNSIYYICHYAFMMRKQARPIILKEVPPSENGKIGPVGTESLTIHMVRPGRDGVTHYSYGEGFLAHLPKEVRVSLPNSRQRPPSISRSPPQRGEGELAELSTIRPPSPTLPTNTHRRT